MTNDNTLRIRMGIKDGEVRRYAIINGKSFQLNGKPGTAEYQESLEEAKKQQASRQQSGNVVYLFRKT